MPIARSLIRLHRKFNDAVYHKLALDLTLKASCLPGMIHFTRATAMAPSTDTGKTLLPMRFATEEQAARGKWQTVNVMHRSLHIESYEIFTEEVDGDEGGRKVEEGKPA